MKQKIRVEIVIVALVCMTLLELMALYKGINGMILTMVIAAIACAAGIAIPTEKVLK